LNAEEEDMAPKAKTLSLAVSSSNEGLLRELTKAVNDILGKYATGGQLKDVGSTVGRWDQNGGWYMVVTPDPWGQAGGWVLDAQGRKEVASRPAARINVSAIRAFVEAQLPAQVKTLASRRRSR
jgi:hypothetical protein